MAISDVDQLILKVDQADSADALLEAVEDLAEASSKKAIPTLIQVLGFNNPGAAVAAVDGLIKIGDPVIPFLLESLDDYNYGARAWSLRVFAGVGDPVALDLLLKAAVTDFSQSVRRAAARGLGTINWLKLPSAQIADAQQQVLETLLLATEDGEWVVRYAVAGALQSLAQTQPSFRSQIKLKLQFLVEQDPEVAIQARAKLALANISP